MGRTAIAALLLLAVSTTAHAEAPDWQNWYRRAITAAKSLVQRPPPDRDVIAAPSDLDGKMALIPPPSGPRMPVIRPETDRRTK